MKYFDAFAGVGGFSLGIKAAIPTAECIGFSEIDKFAISVYKKHFTKEVNYGDITKIKAGELPDFDCLVGGFPCQAFSIAGKRGGFEDTRGTLFFDLARILQAKKPRLFVFENVKGLLNHQAGRTFKIIITTITELGYDCQWQVLNSKNHGVPQNRERVFIIGHLRGTPRPEVFPLAQNNSEAIILPTITTRVATDSNGTYISKKSPQKINQINSPTHSNDRVYNPKGISPTLTMQGGNRQPKIAVPEATKKGYAEATVGDSINLQQINSKTRRGRVGKGIANTLDTSMHQYTIQPVLTPDRLKKRQNGRRMKETGEPSFTLTAQDRHGIYDGVSIRRLTPLECERLQAFPDNWTKYGINEKGEEVEISDSQRYKMCGNAVTTTVVRDIFKRLVVA